MNGNSPLVAIAKRWLQAGFSVIPVSSDKRAYVEWKPYQVRPYQMDEVERVFNDPRAQQIAIVCGYGGMFCFDFDADKGGIAIKPIDIKEDYYTPWSDTAESLGIPLVTQDTPSGGIHALMVCPSPIGNQQLARVPAKPKGGRTRTHTTIETRGTGGYYVLYNLELDPHSLHSISDEQYQLLLEAAVALDETPEATTDHQAARQARGTGNKANATTHGLVGWFNEQQTVTEILARNQYRRVHNKWLAPSSASGNPGVTIFQDDNGLELCYSHHSDELGDGHAHDAFDTMKLLEFHGNFESALGHAKQLKDAQETRERFTFGAEPRARVPSAPLATNTQNPVQDATTIYGHPLATNPDLATKDADLWPETQKQRPQIENPAQDRETPAPSTLGIHLRPTTGHKGPSHSHREKPISGQKPTPSEVSGLLRKWGERDQPPPVGWLVHHLFQDNAENLLAGEPGVGKSWISGDLAVAVATGSAFMDRHTQQGSVAILNFDDPSESLPRMFAERAARARGYELNELDIYYWQPDEKRPYPPEGLITPELFEALLEQMSLIRPRLIIVDAFSSTFPNLDGNKGQDAIRAFEALRQLRIAAGPDCCLVLVDHTPKATMQDSNRRGVSGSQQKHAKTRTVHIVRHVEPGDVNGDDVLSWEVFKANAAPRQESFGVDREMDSLLNTAKLTTRPLPQTGAGAMYDRAAKAAITFLKSRAGEVIQQQDLLTEIVSVANVSMRTARRGLRSNEFLDHPQVQRAELGGRGNPVGYSYEPETEERISLYDQLRNLVNNPDAQFTGIDTIREAFTLAETGDDEAKDRIDNYLAREEVRDFLARARREETQNA